jgi:arylsulfatase A-like enzyme
MSDRTGILSVLAPAVVNVPKDHNRAGAMPHARLIAISHLVPQPPESLVMPKQPSPLAPILSGALFVAVMASVACGLFVMTDPRAELNLMVITLDTFRADRLGAYGSRRGLTPHLDRFAEEGVLFETTQSVAPLTLPAHSSLFTGQFPPGHGVHDNADVLGDRRGGDTLAEVLARSGFRTGAFLAATVLDTSRGLNRGFSHYDAVLPRLDAYGRQHGRRRADEVVARALQWLDVVEGSRFLAWLHFYDAHAPYESPAPFRDAHSDPYDGAVAFIDAQVGVLLDILERRGLLDRTVVVVVGDHGESLGDHGEWTHGLFVYESVLHVPLMIRAPRSALRGRRVSGLTRSVDVMPTVLELLGVRHEARMDGESLLPFMAGTRPDLDAYAENLYPNVRFGWSTVRALRSGRYKVIDTARPELYDLQHDPEEQWNLFATRRDVAEAMLQRLRGDEYLSVNQPGPGPPAIDPELQKRLGALGYVSVARSAAALDAHGGGPRDPKDMVDDFNRLTSPRGIHVTVTDRAPATSEELP